MSFIPAEKKVEKEFDSENKLMCQAHNCPNRWSVDAGNGKLCSAHAWADPMDWGAVTQRIHSAQFTKVSRAPEPPMEPMTPEEKRYVLQRLAEAFRAPKDYKAWAYALKAREEAGEQLSPLKRKMWRTALKVRDDA